MWNIINTHTATAANNHDLQQQVASSTRAICTSSGDNRNGQVRRENSGGIRRGVIRENQLCNDRVDVVDGVELGCRKRKLRESVSSLSRLVRSCCRRCNH